MRLLIHDRPPAFDRQMQAKFDRVIFADGHYAPCQGCFQCWTKTPASCKMKDRLQEISRVIGQAEDIILVTENCYGGFSPAVKNILDRSIASSTPMSTYRGGQMHHTLRYGHQRRWSVYVYGDTSPAERRTWALLVERNAINEGFPSYDLSFIEDLKDLEDLA
ncbi:NAD(P)H-dependent oxidoreductase [Peptococcus simiae]|uniref:NAD(P)H-dependent oxidoreductase n=1 Tax=Peptococcus simiae TaxID=1643805 RepID=A0ABW9GYQ4_9FIRM